LIHPYVEEVISIAEASLGGLRGRSALLVGPEEQRHPYSTLLHQAEMKYVYQEDTHFSVPSIIPHVQLLLNLPDRATLEHPIRQLTASAIAEDVSGDALRS